MGPESVFNQRPAPLSREIRFLEGYAADRAESPRRLEARASARSTSTRVEARRQGVLAIRSRCEGRRARARADELAPTPAAWPMHAGAIRDRRRNRSRASGFERWTSTVGT